jgi:TonB family protein
MRRLILRTTIVPLALLSAALVTPAHANWFFNPALNISRNVGSAPNPTPQDLRETRSPAYPLISKSLNEQGTVGLKIALSQRGVVMGAVVERTSGFQRLDDAAVDYAMAQWHYQPGVQALRDMPAEMRLDVTFKLV